MGRSGALFMTSSAITSNGGIDCTSVMNATSTKTKTKATNANRIRRCSIFFELVKNVLLLMNFTGNFSWRYLGRKKDSSLFSWMTMVFQAIAKKGRIRRIVIVGFMFVTVVGLWNRGIYRGGTLIFLVSSQLLAMFLVNVAKRLGFGNGPVSCVASSRWRSHCHFVITIIVVVVV